MKSSLLAGFLPASILAAGSVAADPADDLIRSEMGKHQVAGVACAVVRDGRAAKTACYGVANLEWNDPVTEDTRFEIGSLTKQFTAACVLLLVEEGKLSLADKIGHHLNATPPAWSGITVQHLLTHTSGITNYTRLEGFEFRQHLSQKDFIKKLAPYPLAFAPGDSWAYSNSGYNLLGFIIENVTGRNYWDFLRERVLQPLQMTNTTRRDPGTVLQHRAAGYEMTNHVRINRDYDLTDIFSAGAIVSTIADLTKWDAALNGNTLLKDSSRELWWKPTTLNTGTVKQYGFGWFLDPFQGHKNIGHGGATSGFSASLQRFPDEHLSVILLSNTDELDFANVLARKVALLYLPGKAPPR